MAPEQRRAPDVKLPDLLSVPDRKVKKRSSAEAFIGIQAPKETPPSRAKSSKIEVDPEPGEDVDIFIIIEQQKRKRMEDKKNKPRVCRKVRCCYCHEDIFNSQKCCGHSLCDFCYRYDKEPPAPIVPFEAPKIPDGNHDDVWEEVRARAPVPDDEPVSASIGRDPPRARSMR